MTRRQRKLALLKLSGEVLCTKGEYGYSFQEMHTIGRDIATVHRAGRWLQAIVLGGGNNLRGNPVRERLKLRDGASCDYAGMLATIQNTIIFQQFLEEHFKLEVIVATALQCDAAAEPHIRRKVLGHLDKGRIVLLAGGLGEPGFSTDTAMVRRGIELGADMILKGTKIDGVYDKDPAKHADAKHLGQRVDATDFLKRRLKIVDSTAVTMARDAEVQIHIFDIFKKGNYKKVLAGRRIGSTIVP